MKRKDHDPMTGRKTGAAEIEYLKKQRALADRMVSKRTARELAVERNKEFIDALHEHLSEAYKDGNGQMIALYATVLNALLRTGPHNIDVNGKLQITLDLARQEW